MKNHLEKSKMGSKKIRGFVLMLIFSYFCELVLSSSPLQQETLPSGKNSQIEAAYEQSKNGVNSQGTSRSAIEENVKLRHRIGYASSGGRGGRPTNSGDSSGGSSGSRTPTGTTFIPVYAAGAVNNHHPSHRGAANYNRIGALALVAAAVASFLQLYATFWCG